VRTTLILLAAVLLGRAAAADEVFLKGGGKVSGRIVSRTETKIEVDVGAGRIGVPMSSVLRIEEGRSPLHAYAERAAQIAAGDADAWVALGEWAEAQGLGTQAREAYRRALAASPSDPRANQGLGNVLLDGRWVSEDEAYQARGYVRFEGEWITPVEHEAILRQRAAEDDRQRQRQEADARVIEAEQRAQQAEDRAEEAEARAQEAEEQASEGIPLWYAWGGGPGYWPSGPIVVAPSRPVTRPKPVPR
jgi:tetratricopeptide (TPR) repeat protein